MSGQSAGKSFENLVCRGSTRESIAGGVQKNHELTFLAFCISMLLSSLLARKENIFFERLLSEFQGS